MIESSVDVAKAVDELGLPLILKAQVLSVSRLKNGLVLPMVDRDDVRRGVDLVSAHPEIPYWLVEQFVPLRAETYIAIRYDDVTQGARLYLGSQGGSNIEDAFESKRLAISSFALDPMRSLYPYHFIPMLKSASWAHEMVRETASLLGEIWKLFLSEDFDMIEINPLALTEDGRLMVLDCKASLEDVADFRRLSRPLMVSGTEESELPRRARANGAYFADMDGEIALFGMGAGLTMSAFDEIHYQASTAANFLDVTGGVDATRISNITGVMVDKCLSSSGVKSMVLCALLVATPLDAIVDGLVEYLSATKCPVPIYAYINASSAALRNISMQEVSARLQSVGVNLTESIETAVRLAVSTAPRSELARV